MVERRQLGQGRRALRRGRLTTGFKSAAGRPIQERQEGAAEEAAPFFRPLTPNLAQPSCARCVRSLDDLSPAPPDGRGGRAPAPARAPPTPPPAMETGHRRRRRAAQRAQRRAGGQGGRRLGRAGDRRRADLRAVAGDRPGQLGDVKAPAGFDSADPDSPRLQLVARRPRGAPRQRRRACARCSWSPARGRCGRSQVPGRHSVRYKPRPDLFGQFARAAALRYAAARRPLDPLERAESAALAAAAEHVQRQALHALRAAPLPQARARRLSGDQDRRPHVDRALRRAGAQRRERHQAERAHASARLHPLDGLRQDDAQARSQRAVRGLQAADRRRLRLPPARHHARAQRAAGDPRQRLDRRPAAPGAHARRHPARRRAQEARRRQVRPVPHRVGLPDASRPTGPAACRWPSSRATSSRARTSATRTRASSC